MNYKIEVSMTSAYHDCPNAPYFWCILGRKEEEQNWFNYGHGWAVTPAETWSLAYEYYKDFIRIQQK